jgi:hypothetical protein
MGNLHLKYLKSGGSHRDGLHALEMDATGLVPCPLEGSAVSRFEFLGFPNAKLGSFFYVLTNIVSGSVYLWLWICQ